MRADPPVRADGRCAMPGCRKQRKPPATNYGRVEYLRDPWCSTTCCRKFHGTSLALSQPSKAHSEEPAG